MKIKDIKRHSDVWPKGWETEDTTARYAYNTALNKCSQVRLEVDVDELENILRPILPMGLGLYNINGEEKALSMKEVVAKSLSEQMGKYIKLTKGE